MTVRLLDIVQSVTIPYWAPASVKKIYRVTKRDTKDNMPWSWFLSAVEISCDKIQMRPYHFLLARPSFVLRWLPAYARREFRSTSIFPKERDSASDFKLRQEDPVTDSSFEFQCDSKPLEEVLMDHIEKSIFPAWVLFVTEILPCTWRLFYIAQEFLSMFWVEIFVIWQIWVTGNRHKYVWNKTVM
jgi:hypothetical protein